MDYQTLYAKTVVELRALAKEMRVKVPAGTNKQRLTEMLLEAQAAANPPKEAAEPPAPEKAPSAPENTAGTGVETQPPKRPAANQRRGNASATSARRRPANARDDARDGSEAPAAKPAPAAQPNPPQAGTSAPAAPARPNPPAPSEGGIKPRAAAPRRDAPRAPENRVALRRPPEGFKAPPHRQSAPAASAPRPDAPAAQAHRQNASAMPTQRPDAPAAQANGQGIPAATRNQAESAAEPRPMKPAVSELLASGEGGDGAGVLELQPDGYGFLRAENCLPGPNDVYISIAQIRRFNLRMGDYVEGKTRPQREGDRYSAIMYITKVNGLPPEEAANRPRFEDLVPVYPDQRLRLERPGGSLSLRLVDMLAPIGKGQRGMIVSPPKAGKTTLLKQIANAITAGYPDVHLIVLLIDERPEEVTDMQRSIDGEVVYSTFDEMPENHTRVAEMVLARAQRLVEAGKDVVVLMDSITRLARAYNLTIAPTGRSLSGGLDPGALFKPKRFFGAARNMENGGSLTIVATALVDTGSRMDDIIYEEFKGTGNMELHLDRKLSDRRVFPAIDMVRSGTRREELLLTEAEQAGEMQVRRMLGSGKDPEMPEQIISLMTHTHSNEDFFQRLQGWIAVAEKDGYSRGR